jgi:hypothetical protein
MSSTEKNVESVIADGTAIIQQTQIALEKGREMINSTGLNLETDLSRLNKLLNPQQQKMLKEMVDLDNEEIQKDIDIEKNRFELTSKPINKSYKKNRNII